MIVGFMQLMGLHSQAGKEGHCGVNVGRIFERLPLKLWHFDDGWFVLSTKGEYADLKGAQVTSIGATPIDEVCAALTPLMPHDSATSMLSKLAFHLTMPRLLACLGFSDSDSSEFELRLTDGQALSQFAEQIMQAFDNQKLERVVLDVRLNGGGDNTTFGPLIEALREHPKISQPGALFALIGRQIFSAAGNFITVLEQETKVTLLGEATGGGPNQNGDACNFALPNHPAVSFRISTRYHEFDPDHPDPRTRPFTKP